MRLIDADALEARLYHEAFETDTDMQKWDSGCWIRYKMFENILAEMPTIKNPVSKTEQHKDFEWIPCTPNTKFDEFKEFWVTTLNGDVRRLYYRPDRKSYPWTSMYGTFGFSNEAIVAYIPIEEPEPYRQKGE